MKLKFKQWLEIFGGHTPEKQSYRGVAGELGDVKVGRTDAMPHVDFSGGDKPPTAKDRKESREGREVTRRRKRIHP